MKKLLVIMMMFAFSVPFCYGEDIPIIEWSERATSTPISTAMPISTPVPTHVDSTEVKIQEVCINQTSPYRQDICVFYTSAKPYNEIDFRIRASWTNLAANVEGFRCESTNDGRNCLYIILPTNKSMEGEQWFEVSFDDEIWHFELTLSWNDSMKRWQTGSEYDIAWRRLSEYSASAVNPTATPAPASKSTYKFGDIVIFGRYEQDGYSLNGQEPIEWIVLESDGSTATMISKYALDAKNYHGRGQTFKTSVTWENCTLRMWLNSEFIDSAFTTEEQLKLATVTVKADKNPNYDTNQGNDTRDRVWLLSASEVEHFFPEMDARVCYPTEYAVNNGAYKDRYGSWWWLRTSGYRSNYVAIVHDVGVIDHGGYAFNRNRSYGAVRPVISLQLTEINE